MDAEFTALGFYEPGFIHLRVATHDDLTDLAKLTAERRAPAWGSTFLHEYVHFLQDLTSTYGLLNFIHANEFLRNANKQVMGHAGAEFSIPIGIGNDFNWQTNAKLKAIYRGSDDAAKSVRYLRYRKTVETVFANDGTTLTPAKYFVDYYDNGAQTDTDCRFGAIHLKEYMAYAVQKQFDPSKEPDDIPYRLVELLIRSEVPRLAKNTSLIVALCDASLMTYHPADLFFNAIERMKSAPESVPTDVESVYTFTYDNLRPAECDSFDSLFNVTADDSVRRFSDSLSADVFKNNVAWFERLISEARKWRLNKRGFFTELVLSPGVLAPTFAQIVRTLGIPFTTNADFKGYFVSPDTLMGLVIQPYYPKVFQAIINTYRGHRACSLYAFCEAEPKRKITNDDCLRQPWTRVQLPRLCPYAQMWKTWGLTGKTPISQGG